MRKVARVVVVFLATQLAGCYIGPTLVGELKVTRPSAMTSGRTLIASRVITSERTVETQIAGPNLQRILETATVKDIAPDLADRLNERGVATQYRAGFDLNDLKKGQLLLTGSVLPRTPSPLSTGGGVRVTSSVTHLITAILVLYLLPFPIPIFSYLDVEYDVRVLDDEGAMVARASGSALLSFRHHMTLAAVNWRGDPELYKRGMPVFLDALADELGAKLR